MGRTLKASTWLAMLAGAAMGAGSIALVACSSDDDGGTDSGNPKKDSSTGNDSTSNPDNMVPADGSNPMDGNGMDCGPATPLHPGDSGPFCPFQTKLPDGGFPPNCNIGQKCCEPLTADGGPSTCIDGNQNCAQGVTSWGCDEKDDCVQGQNTTCCLQGNFIAKDKFCSGVAFVTGVTGSACKASCTGIMDSGMSEAPLCAKQSDCPNGTTCMSFSKQGKQLGVCIPN